MKKRFIFLVAAFSSMLMRAQDNYFTQYNTSKINTNPAFTGSDSAFVLSAATTFQLPVKDNYNQLFFSADNYFRRLHGGLGIHYNRESTGNGKLVTSRISVTYAPHFELFHHQLVVQPAISVGYFQRAIDWSKFKFGDMIDERSGVVYDTKEIMSLNKKSNIDLSSGILLYTNRLYGGFAMHHFTQPDEGLLGPSKLPARLTFHAGSNLRVGSFILSPNIMYQQQKNFSVFMLGATAKYKWLVVGIAYGDGSGIIPTAGLQSRFFKLSYSYYVINPSFEVHEIHLNWYFKHHKIGKVKSLRLI